MHATQSRTLVIYPFMNRPILLTAYQLHNAHWHLDDMHVPYGIIRSPLMNFPSGQHANGHYGAPEAAEGVT